MNNLNSCVRATVHGAISILNAIGSGYGSAVGISLRVVSEVRLSHGKGLNVQTELGKDLLEYLANTILPPELLSENQINIGITSEIPPGFGLKSSSAVTGALSLACFKIIDDKIDDKRVLNSAIAASVKAGVTFTGAFDDTAACYFGGVVITDNRSRKLVKHFHAPETLCAVVFLPRLATRGDFMSRLPIMSDLFFDSFNLAKSGNYWKAMKLNGVIMSSVSGFDSRPMLDVLKAGAISASISGNGPSIAAVTSLENRKNIVDAFSQHDGRVLISKLNNEKASVEVIE
ncbi:MAG TPA: shikimate kinase [Nitrososphaeraceae archaeon]